MLTGRGAADRVRVLVLEGVDLEVGRGQMLCLMGRNGVGKTTLLGAIAGLNRPWSGRVTVDGRDLAGRLRRPGRPGGRSGGGGRRAGRRMAGDLRPGDRARRGGG